MKKHRKLAIVTGASSGIGRETAIRLLKEGWHVIAAARRLERLTELIKISPDITPIQVDLSSATDLEHFCERMSLLEKPADVLVNNAGYSIRGLTEYFELDEVRRLFEVNLFAQIRIIQACLPGMRKAGKGTIVNISSVSGKISTPLNGAYSASKHAIESFSDTLRLELIPFGIKVVVIRPGPIATEFHEVARQLDGNCEGVPKNYNGVIDEVWQKIQNMTSDSEHPGPGIVSDVIFEACTSKSPKVSYSVGPAIEDLIELKTKLNDEEFYELTYNSIRDKAQGFFQTIASLPD